MLAGTDAAGAATATANNGPTVVPLNEMLLPAATCGGFLGGRDAVEQTAGRAEVFERIAILAQLVKSQS
jgi:hypothetical protein